MKQKIIKTKKDTGKSIGGNNSISVSDNTYKILSQLKADFSIQKNRHVKFDEIIMDLIVFRASQK